LTADWSTECAGASDDEQEDVWYVVAEYATYQRSSMDTVEIFEDIWNKAEKLSTKQDHTCNLDTLGKPTTSISSNR
jgi:hypothetical protein